MGYAFDTGAQQCDIALLPQYLLVKAISTVIGVDGYPPFATYS